MFAQPAAATNQGIVSQYTVTSFHACTSKGTIGRTGIKNVRPVLQTSWIALLRILLPTNQTCLQKIRLLPVGKSCGESGE